MLTHCLVRSTVVTDMGMEGVAVEGGVEVGVEGGVEVVLVG